LPLAYTENHATYSQNNLQIIYTLILPSHASYYELTLHRDPPHEQLLIETTAVLVVGYREPCGG
jgi:hypothetical protein